MPDTKPKPAEALDFAARLIGADDAMPQVEMLPNHWTPEERAEFSRRRRGRNLLLLAALGGFCLIIYAIALVKLHEFGAMW